MIPYTSSTTGRGPASRMTSNVICAVALAAMATAAAHGQSRQVPAPPQKAPIVIHSTTVHTVSDGTIENGYVVLDQGRISAVGAGRPPRTDGAVQRDASGLHVYPGLIAAHTSLGLTEVGAVDVTHDHTEHGRVKPEVRAAVAVNPDSDLLPVARANGILTAVVFPRGGLIAGRCSVIRLDGWTWEQMAIDAEAALVVNWPRTEPISARWMERSTEEQRKEIAEDLRMIDTVFDEAAAYVKAREADSELAPDLRYEAMRDTLSGRTPLFVSAASMGQIESAIGWAARRGLKIVIVGGRQADRAIPLLQQHDVPVIIGGLHELPSRRDAAYDEPFTLPLKFHEAGVRFCIASGQEPAHERNLNHVAATAAAYGLPPEQALRAVTLSAAEIIGIVETHGSIERDKAATLIITSGDPLEITTETLVAFIDGREIDLGSRHKSLYDKYREKYRQLGLVP